ncbi:hypothetical protein ALP54_102760 [Pseudomonas amygdali pv. lachrymans]|nr:hypothetical protein ALQ79_102835 [Pseudomonas amygdali pv. lachrymans]RMT12850.1 hypothetical protein ALP54_102760 [Pseudomonas amygdali pv. lachrymans]
MVDRGRFVGHQARRVFFQMAGADCRRLWRVVTNGLNARLSIAVMVCRQHCSITTKYEVRNTGRSASFLRRRASRPAFPRWSVRNDNLNYRAALRVACLSGRSASSLRRRASRPAFPRWSVGTRIQLSCGAPRRMPFRTLHPLATQSVETCVPTLERAER